jgi:(E)-4-hydroxy-3-methylbut-2-enyl-diphosphate synthase
VAEQVEKALLTRSAPVKVAIMGCAVNGPGEAKEADIGVAGGAAGRGILFRKGKVVRKVPHDQLVSARLEEIDRWEREQKKHAQ